MTCALFPSPAPWCLYQAVSVHGMVKVRLDWSLVSQLRHRSAAARTASMDSVSLVSEVVGEGRGVEGLRKAVDDVVVE
jgi:hypothetical protein